MSSFANVSRKGYNFNRPVGRKTRSTNIKIIYSDKSCKIPLEIKWRKNVYIDWNDILFISHGHWTRKFDNYILRNPDKKMYKNSCFSIILFDTTLDIIAENQDIAIFWVNGLRNLLNHTNEFSIKISIKYLQTEYFKGIKPKQLNNQNNNNNQTNNNINMDTNTFLKISDDFTNTLYYVYQEMMKENEWYIDYKVKMKMNSKYLYKKANQENIKWYQWKIWIRQKLEEHLKLNNRRITQHELICFGFLREFQCNFDYVLPKEIWVLCDLMYNIGIDEVEKYINNKLANNNILIHYFEPNMIHRYSFDELLVYGYIRHFCYFCHDNNVNHLKCNNTYNNQNNYFIYKNVYEICLKYFYLKNDDYFEMTNEECTIYRKGKFPNSLKFCVFQNVYVFRFNQKKKK